MKKRLNYTNRKKISHAGSDPEVRISLRHEGNAPHDLIAAVSLRPRVGFPEDSKLILEATYGPYRERYDLGKTPDTRKEYRELLKHIPPDAAAFKFKIVDVDGILLARSSRMKPEKSGDSGNEHPTDGFVSVQSVDMDSVWRLRLEDGALPVLEVNKELDVKSRLNTDPALKAAIFPAALREILNKYLVCSGEDDPWYVTIFDFAQSLVSEEYSEIPNEKGFELGASEKNKWIDAVIDRYTRQCGFISGFQESEV
jgi:hypothetical protein